AIATDLTVRGSLIYRGCAFGHERWLATIGARQDTMTRSAISRLIRIRRCSIALLAISLAIFLVPRPSVTAAAERSKAAGGGAGSADVPPPRREPVTWYRDVLPIVQSRCQGCHNRGGIGPFPLLTYQDALKRHTKIAKAVKSRKMPPWMPADN